MTTLLFQTVPTFLFSKFPSIIEILINCLKIDHNKTSKSSLNMKRKENLLSE